MHENIRTPIQFFRKYEKFNEQLLKENSGSDLFDLTADMKQKQKTVFNNVSCKILMKLLLPSKVWYVRCVLINNNCLKQ